MTVKQFFKSNAFKCVITLLCVLLVSGIFLTIAYGFLAVSDEEKEARALRKIYGGNAEIQKILEVDGYGDDTVKIDKGYLMGDGNYLIKATGYGGYANGNVTCWVVIEITDGAISGIGKVVIDSQKGQTLMNQYSDGTLSVFDENFDGEPFKPSVITGATAAMTNTAITNSVNGAMDFVKTAQLGDVWQDPFEGFNHFFFDIINHKTSSYALNGDESVTFKLVTNGYGYAGSFEATITVNSHGLIENYVLDTDGSTGNWGDKIPETVKDGSMFKGKDLKFFTDAFGKNMLGKPVESYDDNSVTTGATNTEIASLSTYQCFYMGAYALANYNKVIEIKGESEYE